MTNPNPKRPYKAVVAALVAALTALGAYAAILPVWASVVVAVALAGLATFSTPAD